MDSGSVDLDFQFSDLAKDCFLESEVHFQGELIAKHSMKVLDKRQSTSISLLIHSDAWGLFHWSPSPPNLYDVEFRLRRDEEIVDTVSSYFGLRKVHMENSRFFLNNAPYYQKLVLDQGYWPDTGLTPPSEEALILDIERIKELGFNGLRKHQKIEDERFLYWCDVKGLLVWCEGPSAYEFTTAAVKQCTKEWLAIVEQNYNHPSIVVWTSFNESWGVPRIRNTKAEQNYVNAIYYLTKAIDPMRPVITNDGWEHTISDILTLHDYEQDPEKFYQIFADKEKIVNNEKFFAAERQAFAQSYSYQGQAVIISE